MGIANFLLDRDAVNESIDKDLANALKERRPELNIPVNNTDIKNGNVTLANKILSIYSIDEEVSKENINIDDVVAWLDEYDSYGNIVFDWTPGGYLSNAEVRALALIDPKLLEAIKVFARKYHLLKGDNYDEVEQRRVSDKDIVKTVLDTINRVNILDKDGNRLKLAIDDIKADDRIDEKTFLETLKEIEHIYYNGLHEDLEETIDMGEIPPTVASVEETPVEMPEPSEEIKVAANNDMIQSLINDCWSFITNANSVIATLELDDLVGDKETVKELLNDVVDQTTINIGMLHKVANMVDSSTAELIAAGENKAEQKVSE